jgi:hypothetical protein
MIMSKQTIQQQKSALQAKIALLEQEERGIEETKYVVLGRLISQEMQHDNSLQILVNTLLSSKLNNDAERELFGLEKLNLSPPSADTGESNDPHD